MHKSVKKYAKVYLSNLDFKDCLQKVLQDWLQELSTVPPCLKYGPSPDSLSVYICSFYKEKTSNFINNLSLQYLAPRLQLMIEKIMTPAVAIRYRGLMCFINVGPYNVANNI